MVDSVHGLKTWYASDSDTPLPVLLACGDAVTVRVPLAAGRLSAAQYLVLDALAERHGAASLRLAGEKGIEFHIHDKGNWPSARVALAASFAEAAEGGALVTPSPRNEGVQVRLRAEAARLPRGVAVIHAADNTADILRHALGFIALVERERVVGWQVVAGGGRWQGTARLAEPICRIGESEAPALAAAVGRLLLDAPDGFLAMVMARHGADWLRARLGGVMGRELAPPGALPPLHRPSLLGWHRQAEGLAWLGLPIPDGVVADRGEVRLRSGVLAVVARFGAMPVVTPQGDLLLSGLPMKARPSVEGLLRSHGVPLAQALSPLRRWSRASVAEAALEPVLDGVEVVLERLGLADERVGLGIVATEGRVAGAVKAVAWDLRGHALPQAEGSFLAERRGDILLAARADGAFSLMLGGNLVGTRLPFTLIEAIRAEEVAVALTPLLVFWKARRVLGEGFGDFCARQGAAALHGAMAGADGRCRRHAA